MAMSSIITEGRKSSADTFTRRLHQSPTLSPDQSLDYSLFRLKTFRKARQILGEDIAPLVLADQGFYFDEEKKGIFCATCRERLRRYKSRDDDPRQLHLRDHPDCQTSNDVTVDDASTEDESDSPHPKSEISPLTNPHQADQEKHSIEETNPGLSKVKPNRIESKSASFDVAEVKPTRQTSRQGSSLPADVNLSTSENQASVEESRASGRNSHTTSTPSDQAPTVTEQPTQTRRVPTEEQRNTMNSMLPFTYTPPPTTTPPTPPTTTPPTTTPPTTTTTTVTESLEERKLRMFSEEDRLASFEGRWSTYSYIVSAVELAKNGFFYHGPHDRVICVFCNGVLSRWREGDKAETEHGRHFPQCNFVRGIETRNKPMKKPPVVPSSRSFSLQRNGGGQSRQGSGQGSVRMTRRPLTTQPEHNAGAAHPPYADEAVRLASFDTSKGWPRDTAVTPENLAAAGFFYTGQSDNVRCFHCDGGLRNWEEGDDPSVEHARWFPRCPYLITKVGPTFIENVRERFASQARTSQPPPLPVIPNVPTPSAPPDGLQIDRKHYREALSMGFTEEQIVQAVESMDQSSMNMQSLTEALLGLVPESDSPTPPTDCHSTDAAAKATDVADKPSNHKAKKKKKKKPKSNNNESMAHAAEPLPAASLMVEEESRSLSEENRQLKEQRMCKVCMDEDVAVVFLPCGHLVCCATCAPAMRSCPICRALVRGTIKTYLS